MKGTSLSLVINSTAELLFLLEFYFFNNQNCFAQTHYSLFWIQQCTMAFGHSCLTFFQVFEGCYIFRLNYSKLNMARSFHLFTGFNFPVPADPCDFFQNLFFCLFEGFKGCLELGIVAGLTTVLDVGYDQY